MATDPSDPLEPARDLESSPIDGLEGEGVSPIDGLEEEGVSPVMEEEAASLPADADLLEAFDEEEGEEGEAEGERKRSPYDRPGERVVVDTYARDENERKSNVD